MAFQTIKFVLSKILINLNLTAILDFLFQASHPSIAILEIGELIGREAPQGGRLIEEILIIVEIGKHLVDSRFVMKPLVGQRSIKAQINLHRYRSTCMRSRKPLWTIIGFLAFTI